MILEEASSSVKSCAVKVCEAINNKFEEMFQGTEILENMKAQNETPGVYIYLLIKYLLELVCVCVYMGVFVCVQCVGVCAHAYACIR